MAKTKFPSHRMSSLASVGVVLAMGLFSALSSWNPRTATAESPTTEPAPQARVTDVDPNSVAQMMPTESETFTAPPANPVQPRPANPTTLSEALGNDEVGQELLPVLEANRRGLTSGDLSAEEKSFLTKIQQDPKKGLELIQEGLNRLPAKRFAIDRAALLHAGLAMPGQSNELQRLTARELAQHPVDPRLGQAGPRTIHSDPVDELDLAAAGAVLETYLKTQPATPSILETSEAAIRATSSLKVREHLFAAIETNRPDLSAKLLERLRD